MVSSVERIDLDDAVLRGEDVPRSDQRARARAGRPTRCGRDARPRHPARRALRAGRRASSREGGAARRRRRDAGVDVAHPRASSGTTNTPTSNRTLFNLAKRRRQTAQRQKEVVLSGVSSPAVSQRATWAVAPMVAGAPPLAASTERVGPGGSGRDHGSLVKLHRWRDSCSHRAAPMRHLSRLTRVLPGARRRRSTRHRRPFVACGDSTATDAGPGVSSVIFIKRQHTTASDQGVSVDVAGGNGQVLDYERYVPGGALMLLSPAPSRRRAQEHHRGVPDPPDFNGADVSFDAKQVVFSMKRDGQGPLPHLHGAAERRPRRQVRDPREDGRRSRRHQPDLSPRWPHRVRDERDVHADGYPRRRVRARPRRHPARDDLGRRRRRRSPPRLAEPLAHRRALDPPRRQDRLLALGAPRRRQRREALRRQPRRHADARRCRPARQALERALQRARDRAERDDRHRHHA